MRACVLVLAAWLLPAAAGPAAATGTLPGPPSGGPPTDRLPAAPDVHPVDGFLPRCGRGGATGPSGAVLLLLGLAGLVRAGRRR